MGKDAVVKVDKELLKRVEEFISRQENKLRYINKKQFIDIAVDSLLSKHESKDEGRASSTRKNKGKRGKQ